MEKKTIDEEYFSWLNKLIANDKHKPREYSRLIMHLFNTEFTWLLDMDSNRACDGISLRYRFGLTTHYTDDVVQRALDIRSCSLLEMMIALSLRCEEDIMGDPNDIRVDKWFWVMMDTSGLSRMTNSNYDVEAINSIIDNLLNRHFGPNGEGGYFEVHDTGYDLRDVDIWYIMNWYLNDITKGE